MVPKILYLTGGTLIYVFVILCMTLDVVIGENDKELRDKMQDYFAPTVDMGYLVEKQLLDNRLRIEKLAAEIQNIRNEDTILLRKVLEANGVKLKENEGCDYDLKEKRFMFYDIRKPIR